MDLITRVRTNLVMFGLICFLLYLVILYFYQPVSRMFKEGFLDIGLDYVLENSPNIPIWVDNESKNNFYNIQERRDLVNWNALIEPSKTISKTLSLNNMSFSFWIEFDKSVNKRPETNIFRIMDKQTNTIPFSVSDLSSVLAINYLTQDNETQVSNTISHNNDLYGGNQIGYGNTPTFVFITIQNSIIRLVLNGVEKNKFGEGQLLEPSNHFVIESGYTSPSKNGKTGVLIRDLKIYAEPVKTSIAKIIFDAEKKNTTEGFSTIDDEDVEIDEDRTNFNPISTITAIAPPRAPIVEMTHLILQKMGADCNTDGTFNSPRGTYQTDKIFNGPDETNSTDLTDILGPIIGQPYSPNVAASFRQAIPYGKLVNSELKAKFTNDYGESDTVDLTYAGEGRTNYFNGLGPTVKERNSKNVAPMPCSLPQTCRFFNAGNQLGKCVSEITGEPNRTDSSFPIYFFSSGESLSSQKTRTVSLVDLDNSHYYKIPDQALSQSSDRGMTISFWFKVLPSEFKDLPDDTFLYLMQCGDEIWEKNHLKLNNDVSISVDRLGRVKFKIDDQEEIVDFAVMGGSNVNEPHHIAWVVGRTGFWTLYHQGTFYKNIRKNKLPKLDRKFNMVGGSPLLKYNFKNKLSIGEFKIFNRNLIPANIKYLYEQ